jgi:hypothetical protein
VEPLENLIEPSDIAKRPQGAGAMGFDAASLTARTGAF